MHPIVVCNRLLPPHVGHVDAPCTPVRMRHKYLYDFNLFLWRMKILFINKIDIPMIVFNFLVIYVIYFNDIYYHRCMRF